MRYNPDVHHRKALRLNDYDYSREGAYFVTICVANRECLLGAIHDGRMELSDAGRVVSDTWLQLPDRYPTVVLDQMQIMPNHIHGILFRMPPDPEIDLPRQSASLPQIMRAFKSISAIAANRVLGRTGVPFWQERYHDRVVRDEIELNRMRIYIQNNPSRWDEDKMNPFKQTFEAFTPPQG